MAGCVAVLAACTPRCWVCGDETWFGVACGKLVVFEFFVWSRVGVGMACLAEGRVSESVLLREHVHRMFWNRGSRSVGKLMP